MRTPIECCEVMKTPCLVGVGVGVGVGVAVDVGVGDYIFFNIIIL